jgi:hypothetical protein
VQRQQQQQQKVRWFAFSSQALLDFLDYCV